MSDVITRMIMADMPWFVLASAILLVIWWYDTTRNKGEEVVSNELIGEEEYDEVTRVVEKQPIIIGNDAIREYEKARDMNFYRERLKEKLG